MYLHFEQFHIDLNTISKSCKKSCPPPINPPKGVTGSYDNPDQQVSLRKLKAIVMRRRNPNRRIRGCLIFLPVTFSVSLYEFFVSCTYLLVRSLITIFSETNQCLAKRWSTFYFSNKLWLLLFVTHPVGVWFCFLSVSNRSVDNEN